MFLYNKIFIPQWDTPRSVPFQKISVGFSGRKPYWVAALWPHLCILIILILPHLSHAQGQVPSAGKSGIAEKSLRKSRPQFKPPEEAKTPEIIIEDSRELEDAGAGPAFFVKRIELEGNTVFDDETLYPIVDLGEGLEVSLGILTLFAQEIMAHYASQGYFLAKAYIPQQEIKNGVVKMVIAEGKIGNISVTGNKHIKDKDIINRFSKVKKETVLKEQTLEQTLMELNDLMGVTVRSILKPGDLPGTSDMVLEVTETLPYSFSFDADNFGSLFTGRQRFGISTSAGNLLKLGDQLSFRGVKSNLDQFSTTVTYLIPVTNIGTTLKTSYTFSEQVLGASLFSLNAGGNSHLLNLELGQLLFRSRNSRFHIKAGYDRKYLDNYQLSAASSSDKLNDLYVVLGGNFGDPYLGKNFFDFTLRQGLTEGTIDRLLTSRAKGRGTTTIASSSITRYQGTPFMNSYVILKASGQVASTRTLSTNLFSVGGMGTVRGYPLSEQSGENGYNLSLEYVLPFPLKKRIGIDKLTLDQVVSLTGFVDHGGVYVLRRQSGESDQFISGGGGGVQINVPKVKNWFPALSFSAIYAHPVQGPARSDGSNGIWYLSGLLSYTF